MKNVKIKRGGIKRVNLSRFSERGIKEAENSVKVVDIIRKYGDKWCGIKALKGNKAQKLLISKVKRQSCFGSCSNLQV